MHSGTVIRKEVGLSLEKAGSEVLGNAAKVVLAKESTTIVGDGSTKDAVSKIIGQLKRLSRGADIVKRALRYPMKLIANNAGVNGSVVIEKNGWRAGSGGGLVLLVVIVLPVIELSTMVEAATLERSGAGCCCWWLLSPEEGKDGDDGVIAHGWCNIVEGEEEEGSHW
ncbi:hypothetical protein T459_07124 [Capsicum annuum]|uniref:Uncharacterized protein n=1 Tax=Capsicum annuum TaxID=4072 RepID=A0A2G3ACR4_CAPAN|nr:hypothetical protein T459_07124 [Capsicum annuum]